VGQALTIELSASGAQGNFDNVRLNAEVSPNGNSAVPEPAGLGAVGLGLLAVARRYWRR
jgi:MYXO-CTERM domain-containing protein